MPTLQSLANKAKEYAKSTRQYHTKEYPSRTSNNKKGVPLGTPF